MRKAVIIGGGVAGLSAGCFLQMNGYETELFETHDKAGGLCTSWKRKGYHIDGCIHWWYCTSSIDPIYPALDALLDMKNFPKVTYEEFSSVEADGKILRFLGNLDLFETELKTVAPEDSKTIEEMIAGARKIASTYIHPNKNKEFYKWKLSIEEYSKKIKNPLIKKLLTSFPFTSQSSMYEFLLLAARLHNKDACYPLGGAEKLVDRLVQRYTSLGGTLYCRSKVTQILTEKGKAIGIHLENGKKIIADHVISAADGYNTVHRLLKGQYIDERIDSLYYKKEHSPKGSQIYISLGINRVFKESFKPYLFINLRNPIMIEKEKVNTVGITIHNFDPTSAPAGKTVLTILIPIQYTDYWMNLRKKNKEEYKREKEEIAQHMIEEIDAYFGNIKTQVEMVDVATPATYVRYTDNWHGGAPINWGTDILWEIDGSYNIHKPEKTITGLNNFFMCGQWVGDAGISEGMQSGKEVAHLLCEKEGKPFQIIPPYEISK